MHIAIASPHILPVQTYGGSQRILWSLGKSLVEMGHQVTYLLKKGSHCPFADIRTLSNDLPLQEQVPDSCDVVLTQGNLPGRDDLQIPYIHRVGGNAEPGKALPRNTFFLSRDHAKRHNSHVFVHNGLDWSEYAQPTLRKSGHRFHFLAKVAWGVKNFNGAISVIKQSPQHRLDVIGGSRISFKMGFRMCWSAQARFHGMLGSPEKDAILDNSRGLLFPVRWHEPFGIAIIESLYFGCPVFATPYGSLPELISDDYGFLSHRASELADALHNIDHYHPEQCHLYAKETFSAMRMTENYLALMQRVINGEQLNPTHPEASAGNRGLDWEA